MNQKIVDIDVKYKESLGKQNEIRRKNTNLNSKKSTGKDKEKLVLLRPLRFGLLVVEFLLHLLKSLVQLLLVAQHPTPNSPMYA